MFCSELPHGINASLLFLSLLLIYFVKLQLISTTVCYRDLIHPIGGRSYYTSFIAPKRGFLQTRVYLCSSGEDEELKARCHYRSANVDNVIYHLDDDVFVKVSHVYLVLLSFFHLYCLF